MAKFVLTLWLATAQFLSGIAAPVYLCLGCDGSVCIDLGKSNCVCDAHCEHDDHALDAGRVWQSAEHALAAEASARQFAHDANSCDCTHVQISCAAPRAVLRAATDGVGAPLAPAPLALGLQSPRGSFANRAFESNNGAASPLCLTDAVVLRC